MKLYVHKPSDSPGGINRVLASLHTYLPEYGIEIVDSRHKADVSHAHVGLYEDYSPQQPLVVSSHGMLWEEDGWHKTGWKVNKLCAEAYIQADVVTAPSVFVAKAIERNTLVRPRVVRHGIAPEEWLPGTNEGYVLWNKGRPDAACNPEAMQKLAALAPDQQFVSTFGNKAANVHITGGVPHASMKELVRQAGVYLITPRESGGPSFGVLEAMSCGVPVLSWNYGGTAEAVDHLETGYLAREGDYSDLLEGLHYCINNRERLGQNARQKVIEQYDVRSTIMGYIEAYNAAVEPVSVPLVSIIIPCYNLGSFLPAAVKSAAEQMTPEQVEVIIINDASTDGSGEVADQLAQQYPNVKVIHNETNQHVAASRNTGIKASTGLYIVPLDADDRLFPGAVQKMVSELDNSREHQIVSGKLVIYPEQDLEKGYRGGWPNGVEYDLQRTGYNRLPYCSMYRRKVWENIGGYRTRLRSGVEDADFWTRALSFGYKATLLDADILRYTNRNSSLGKGNARGVEAWLPWFPWAEDVTLSPVAATGDGPYTTLSYDSPEVSVVVPIGPGHVKYIQTITDGMVAQSFRNWELVLVNDSGAPLPDHVPFAVVINMPKNSGVAAARNAGIQAARADKIVLLDADDVPQPRMLEILLKAHEVAGGWIYGDWYYTVGDGLVFSTSEDWAVKKLLEQSLGPITGLYEKEHLLLVGGFDTEAPGWEDWSLHLSLLEQGICGTRVEYPLIVYNMHYGARREDNFARRKEMLQYIGKKHNTLYGGKVVACSKCGGKKTLTVKQPVAAKEAEAMPNFVTLVYEGPLTGKRHFTGAPSKTKQVVQFRRPFNALKEDVEYYLARPGFKVVKSQEPPAQAVQVVSTAPLINEMPAEAPVLLTSDLDLPPETLAFLSAYPTVSSLAKADDAQLLAIKGIGESRLKQIREAVAASGSVA